MLHRVLFLCALLFAFAYAALPEIKQSDRDAFPGNLKGLTLVEFYSPKCKHCRAFAKTIERLVAYIDAHTDDLGDIQVEQFSCRGGKWCRLLKVTSIPSLRLYRDDQVIGELKGANKFTKIVKWLKDTIDEVSIQMNSTDQEFEEEETSQKEIDDDWEARPPAPMVTRVPRQTVQMATTPTPLEFGSEETVIPTVIGVATPIIDATPRDFTHFVTATPEMVTREIPTPRHQQ